MSSPFILLIMYSDYGVENLSLELELYDIAAIYNILWKKIVIEITHFYFTILEDS